MRKYRRSSFLNIIVSYILFVQVQARMEVNALGARTGIHRSNPHESHPEQEEEIQLFAGSP